jgi:hypothetical protein
MQFRLFFIELCMKKKKRFDVLLHFAFEVVQVGVQFIGKKKELSGFCEPRVTFAARALMD